MGKISDAWGDLPWIIQGIIVLAGLDLFHTVYLHSMSKVSLNQVKRHTHENNGTAIVPTMWNQFKNQG